MSVRPLSHNAWIHGGKEGSQSGLVVEELERVEGLEAAVDGTQG